MWASESEGEQERKRDTMVEKNPWWKNVDGPWETWNGPVGCKEDGGGCHRGQGLVGNMIIHRAVNNHDLKGNELLA